ncbi:hypothetical protein [Sorangium sp. So ce426]|uniref:hypothetical protein n=1 Tax=Sorangium sp. So ce426 TaxID=3133312 RepID=UPI003F5BB8F3
MVPWEGDGGAGHGTADRTRNDVRPGPHPHHDGRRRALLKPRRSLLRLATLAAAIPSRAGVLLGLALAAACSAAPERPPRPAQPPAAALADPLSLSPARYVLTEDIGVLLDAAAGADERAPAPRPEPALFEGRRVRLDGGVVLADAPAAELLRGFRSIPARLGGGFLLWSEGRVYRAADFLGELAPIADVGAPGGARPYLDAILLRSDRGLLEIDPSTLAVRRFGAAGVVDAVAVDARRAARLDLFGRASVTLDGGATWIDVLETRGLATSLLEEQDGGRAVALLAPLGGATLHVSAAGLAPALPPPPRAGPSASLSLPPARDPTLGASSVRALAPAGLALAAATGALLPGGRLLVARDGVLAVFAAATAQPLAEAAIESLDPSYARCQPFRSGDDVLLACAHEGAQVLRLETTLSAPQLEATFPPRGRGLDPIASPHGAFVGDDRGRLAFLGRCGSVPPGLHDFPESPGGAGPTDDEAPWPPRFARLSPDEPREDAASREPADEGVTRVCVRVGGGRWVERRIEGEDADRLYRWIVGERGTVTALVLEAPEGPRPRPRPRHSEEEEDEESDEEVRRPSEGEEEDGAPRRSPPGSPARGRERPAGPPEGVRVVRVRDRDPALAGGAFPALAGGVFAGAADASSPPRLIDTDFWEDDDGAARGWLHLPEEAYGVSPAREALPEAGSLSRARRAERLLSRRRGGRIAGLRIDARGGVTVFPLPAGVQNVVVGGRFALAATGDDPPAFFESTDGGRSWRPAEGPPARQIEPPFDEGAPFACSPIGCAMGEHGLVRLGWGGPPPSPRGAPPPFAPAVNPALRAAPPPLVSCRLDDDPSSFPPPSAAPAPPPSGRRAPRGTPVAGGVPATARLAGGAPPVVSLSSAPSSPLGALRDGTFTASVLLPFARAGAPRRLSLRDGSLGAASGDVVPVLLAPGARAPADLLLLFDASGPHGRRGLRVRAGAEPPALLPFDNAGTIAAAVELPGGELLALDAGRRSLLVAVRQGTFPAFGLARVPELAGARLTLGRRLDAPGVALIGYSVASGEVVAGPIDVARGQVGPIEPLGTLASLAAMGAGGCGGARPSHRFIAELPATLRVASRSGAPLFEGDAPASALLSGGRGALCVEAIEIRAAARGGLDLGVVFGPDGAAALRDGGGGGAVRLRCELM